jgi:hypothetical protein
MWPVLFIWAVFATVFGVVMGRQVEAEQKQKWDEVHRRGLSPVILHVSRIDTGTVLGKPYWEARLANEEGKNVFTRGGRPELKVGDTLETYHLGNADYFIPKLDAEPPTTFIRLAIAMGLTPLTLRVIWKAWKWGRWPAAPGVQGPNLSNGAGQ